MHSPRASAGGPVDLDTSGDLFADYSQVELHAGEGGHVELGDIGLAREDPSGERGYATLTTARQFGPAPFQVHLRATESPRDPAAAGAEPDTHRYLLQVWPAPSGPPRVVTSTAAWAQYWTFGPAAEELVDSLTDATDPAQLRHVLDRALRDHPDTAARIRSGIIRYAQELFRGTSASRVHEKLRVEPDALSALIDARAAALT